LNKKWMPIAAGILDIISGTLQLWVALYALRHFVLKGLGIAGFNLLTLIIALPCFFTGVVAIIGGIYIIQRKKRYIVYLGALAAFIPLIIPSLFLYGLEGNPIWWCIMLIGIGAIVLSLRAEKEFD
jgi:hypothetical protein